MPKKQKYGSCKYSDTCTNNSASTVDGLGVSLLDINNLTLICNQNRHHTIPRMQFCNYNFSLTRILVNNLADFWQVYCKLSEMTNILTYKTIHKWNFQPHVQSFYCFSLHPFGKVANSSSNISFTFVFL